MPEEHMVVIKKFVNDYPKVTLEIESTEFTRTESQERGQRMTEALQSKGYRDVGFSIDGDDLEILTIAPAEDRNAKVGELSLEEVASLVGLQADSQQMKGARMMVYDAATESLQVDEHTYGGRRISGGGRRCTTGFTVIDGTGRTGVATAAHCTG